MNGFLLAAIVVVALLVAVLLLKKRNSHNKISQIETVDQAETAAQPIEPAPAAGSPLETDAVMAAEESAVTVSEAESVALLSKKVEFAPEPVGFDLDEDAPLATIEDALLFVEPGEAAVESLVEVEELEKNPVELDSSESISLGQENAPAQDEIQPDRIKDAEAVPVVEGGAPAGAVKIEERASAAETVVEEQLVSPVREGDVAVGVETFPQVCLAMDVYSMRLNNLEEKQRTLLAQAIQRQDDKKRDQLQRELVIMNDKLALLADSYDDEMQCYQRVLDALQGFQDDIDGDELAVAKARLQEGEPRAAENFLALLSEQNHPAAAQAAFYSGQLAFCRVDLQKALDLYRRAVELEPQNPQYLQAAGKTACRLYRYKEALSWLEAFVTLSSGKDIEPLDKALAQRELAYTYVLSGQYQKAGPLYKESMTVLAKTLGQDHPEMATSWYQIGELQETLGEYDKAVSLYKKSLEILEKKRGKDHPVLANIIDKLAALCMELEMEKQAVPLYQRLVHIREKALRPTHPQLALSLNNLAESYRLQGQYAEAEACYQKSLVINETIHGPEHPSVAAILQELAKLCNSQRKPEEAQQYQQRATTLFQKSVDASEKKTGQEALTLEI